LKGFTDTSDLTIWRSAVYRFHALLGQSWRDRRVLMMGDAVHQTPPFLGQGLCAGIRDAANLAWKLALVLRGDADEALLDSYETERKPHVRAVVASAKEFGTIIGELDPDAAAKRDARLRAELKSGRAVTIRQKFIPDLEGGLIARDAKLAGRLFVQPRVRTADGHIKRLDDELKLEFVIVTRTKEAMSGLSAAALSAWQKLGGERVVIGSSEQGSSVIPGRCTAPNPESRDSGFALCAPRNDGGEILTVVETEHLLVDWMRDNGVEAVIVRPDRYVFGGGATASELNALVADLVSKLQGGP
jgi:3-(3-hydroxy-phenyl)propionate hydroxylase